MSRLVLGLGGPFHHDGSACLINGDRIVAFAEEERFTRRKHNKDSRSCALSASYCLSVGGVSLGDLDEVAIAWNPRWPQPVDYVEDLDLVREILDPRGTQTGLSHRLTVVDHHVAHAASAFYPSGFTESAVLVVDGSGDGTSTSTYHGTPAGLRLLHRYPFTQSLGWFYETVAEHIGLGDWTSSGKLMGLAAHGRAIYDLDFLTIGNGYFLDLTAHGMPPHPPTDDEYTSLGYYNRLKGAYSRAYETLGIPRHRRSRRYDADTGRTPDDGSFVQAHADLAASAQWALERCLLELTRQTVAETGCNRLCLAGGVALNCSANGALWSQSCLDDLFVQPAAGDAGCAIGAALVCAHRSGQLRLPAPRLTDVAFGPGFTDAAIHRTLEENLIRHKYYGDDISKKVAEALATGALAGWFQGRLEAGPRALGHRSIVGDPRAAATRERVNRHVKRREPWRPLAPSILESAMPKVITNPGPADFMIVAYEATDWARTTMPAAVHVDGTMRPQAVRRQTNPEYHRLLAEFEDRTGCPGILNTSFNADNEPIVCTPSDALRTFFASPLEVLAMGGFLIDGR